MAAKNRIQNPGKVLHYYNAPLDLDEDKIKEASHVLIAAVLPLPNVVQGRGCFLITSRGVFRSVEGVCFD